MLYNQRRQGKSPAGNEWNHWGALGIWYDPLNGSTHEAETTKIALTRPRPKTLLSGSLVVKASYRWEGQIQFIKHSPDQKPDLNSRARRDTVWKHGKQQTYSESLSRKIWAVRLLMWKVLEIVVKKNILKNREQEKFHTWLLSHFDTAGPSQHDEAADVRFGKFETFSGQDCEQICAKCQCCEDSLILVKSINLCITVVLLC